MISTQNKPLVVIACQVFQSLLETYLPENAAQKTIYKDYGLHRTPAKLTWSLQEEIDAIQVPSLILLAYGLCGNGLNGIQARSHTLLIPRTDDCIAILLGSYQRYMQEFNTTPGTYYLTKGWLESGSNPLQEFREYRQKYSEKEAAWIMDQQYQHYNRLAFVAHNQEDLEYYRPLAQEVAEFCQRWDMRYEEIIGSDTYIRNLVELCKWPHPANGDFLIISPGAEITQKMFIR